MKSYFPKNKYQLHSCVELKPTSEKSYINKIIMRKKLVIARRRKKGYGFGKYKI